MAGEPQNLVLSLLREIRAEMAADRAESRDQLAALSKDVSALNKDMGKKLESLRLAMHGESVLGRYTAAEV